MSLNLYTLASDQLSRLYAPLNREGYYQPCTSCTVARGQSSAHGDLRASSRKCRRIQMGQSSEFSVGAAISLAVKTVQIARRSCRIPYPSCIPCVICRDFSIFPFECAHHVDHSVLPWMAVRDLLDHLHHGPKTPKEALEATFDLNSGKDKSLARVVSSLAGDCTPTGMFLLTNKTKLNSRNGLSEVYPKDGKYKAKAIVLSGCRIYNFRSLGK